MIVVLTIPFFSAKLDSDSECEVEHQTKSKHENIPHSRDKQLLDKYVDTQVEGEHNDIQDNTLNTGNNKYNDRHIEDGERRPSEDKGRYSENRDRHSGKGDRYSEERKRHSEERDKQSDRNRPKREKHDRDKDRNKDRDRGPQIQRARDENKKVRDPNKFVIPKMQKDDNRDKGSTTMRYF